MADQDYPHLYEEMEAAAQRTRSAAIAFEHVLGGPEADMVPVNGWPNQPTIAGRVKARIDPLVETLESAAESVKRFAGVHPVAPTTRSDGSPLQPGDEYQNSGTGLRYSWTGSAWALLNGSVQQLTTRLASSEGSQDIGFGGTTVEGALNGLEANSLRLGEVLIPTPAGTSLTRGTVHAFFPLTPLAGAIRMGASDLTSLNDERNFWRGLPSQDAWGDPRNIGFASAAFNRNGASIGSYSTTFGHDCVTYGTASMAGGAGCATGSPDLPIETGNFTGYCALSFGKNNIAIGEKSVCIGEEHLINTRAGVGLGYAVVSQPSVTEPSPAGAAGIGRSIDLFGQAHAFGANISASDGVVVGFGPNPGTKLRSTVERSVSIGAGTQLGALLVVEPTSGQIRSQVAINCQRALDPNIETRIDLGDGKTLGIVTDGFGSSKFSLRGLKGDGSTQPIVDFEWSNPNSGSSAGGLSVKMNGRSTVAFGLLADGTPIFQELKDAAGISGAPAGAMYRDAGGALKVV